MKRYRLNSYLDSWPLKMGPIGSPETSVLNYQYSLHNKPQQRNSIFDLFFIYKRLGFSPSAHKILGVEYRK